MFDCLSQQDCVYPADLLPYGQQYKTDLGGRKQKLTKSKAKQQLKYRPSNYKPLAILFTTSLRYTLPANSPFSSPHLSDILCQPTVRSLHHISPIYSASQLYVQNGVLRGYWV
jgi:hypothetical protein